MSRTREIVCENYICEHECKRNRDAVFYGICQTCPFYIKKKRAKPARVNNKRKKIEKNKMKDSYSY